MVSNIQEKSMSFVDGILQRAIDASYRNARPVSSGLALRFGLQEIARRADPAFGHCLRASRWWRPGIERNETVFFSHPRRLAPAMAHAVIC